MVTGLASWRSSTSCDSNFLFAKNETIRLAVLGVTKSTLSYLMLVGTSFKPMLPMSSLIELPEGGIREAGSISVQIFRKFLFEWELGFYRK